MSTAIVERAKAKVNLALHVLGRRADGYHELDSIVGFADVVDVLHVEAAEQTSLVVTGPFAAAVPEDGGNLILRAHAMLREHVVLPAVRVHLEKNLPVVAGIGGGSADAAAALRALITFLDRPIDDVLLQRIALALGADVPVCLRQRASRMMGIGERLSDIECLPAPAIVLVNPGVPCSTAAVFARLGLMPGAQHLSALDPTQPKSWRNDLTAAAEFVQPAITDVLLALAACGELTDHRMSGSGATCFGLAPSMDVADAVATRLKSLRPDWWVCAASLG